MARPSCHMARSSRRWLPCAFAALIAACGSSVETNLVSDDAGDRMAAIAHVKQLPADERARIVAYLGDVIRNPTTHQQRARNPETHAVEDLIQMPESAGPALPALIDLIEGNLSPAVTANIFAREGAFDVIAAMGPAAQPALPRLAQFIRKEQPGSHRGQLALKTMILIGDPAVEQLKMLAADPAIQYPQTRDFYIQALQSIGTATAQQALAELGP